MFHNFRGGVANTYLALKHFRLLAKVMKDQHVIFCEEHIVIIPLDLLAK